MQASSCEAKLDMTWHASRQDEARNGHLITPLQLVASKNFMLQNRTMKDKMQGKLVEDRVPNSDAKTSNLCCAP